MKLLTVAVFLGLVTYVLCATIAPYSQTTVANSSITTTKSTTATTLPTTNSPTSTIASATTQKSSETTAVSSVTAGNPTTPKNGGSSVSFSSLWTVCLSVAFFKFYSRY